PVGRVAPAALLRIQPGGGRLAGKPAGGYLLGRCRDVNQSVYGPSQPSRMWCGCLAEALAHRQADYRPVSGRCRLDMLQNEEQGEIDGERASVSKAGVASRGTSNGQCCRLLRIIFIGLGGSARVAAGASAA